MNTRPLILLGILLCGSATAQQAVTPLESLLESGRVGDAVSVLELKLGENPYDPVQLNNLAVARARQAEYFGALELLDRAARLAPENTGIADNRRQLRDWLAQRIGANSRGLEADARALPSGLPPPPPLWE